MIRRQDSAPVLRHELDARMNMSFSNIPSARELEALPEEMRDLVLLDYKTSIAQRQQSLDHQIKMEVDQHTLQTKAQSSATAERKRGQWMGFGIAVGSLIVALSAAFLGMSFIGVGGMLVGISVVVAAFMTGRVQDKSRLDEELSALAAEPDSEDGLDPEEEFRRGLREGIEDGSRATAKLPPES